MRDSQYIVDQIRGFIAALDQVKTPELVELAVEYAALCNEANARLRRCTDYLHRGLRAEAIHLADEHPVLLDVVAALDLPEMAQWADLCSTYQMVRPPQLLMEAAQELNEAYAIGQPIEAMLDRLRRLALDRAPLGERIAIMREVAKVDTTSTFWDEDLRTFETVRLKELKSEAVRSAEMRDSPALARLLAELSSPDWRMQVPPDLRTRVQRAELAIRQQETSRQISELLPELDVAYSAMDFNAVTATLMKIRSLAAQTDLALPPEVAAQVEPAEQWVARQNAILAAQQQFAEACETLAIALDHDAPAARLETLKGQALRLGGEIPADLTRRLEETIARQGARKKRIARIRIVTVAAALVVAGGVAAMIVRSMNRSNRGDEVNTKLTALLDSGTPEDLDSADQYLKKVAADSPYVMDRADIQRRIVQLAASRKLENERAGTYAADLAAAKAALDSAVARNQPGVLTWKGVNDVIDKAAQSAQTSAENTAVSELREKAMASSRQIKTAEEQKLRKSLAELTVKTASVRDEINAGNGMTKLGAIDSIVQEALAVQAAAADAGLSPVVSDAGALMDSLAQVKTTLVQKTTERDELEAVKRAIATPELLAQALESFAVRCPDSEHAARFKNSAANVRAWEAVAATAKLSGSWGGALKPAVAQLPDRIQAMSDYLRDYSQSPWHASIDAYSKYLVAWQKTVSDDGPWKKDFRSLLTLPLLKDRTCCKGVDGRIFYLPPGEVLANKGGGVAFNYMTSSAFILNGDAKALRAAILPQGQINGGATLSPQSVLAADLDKLADSLGEEWETFGYDVASKIADSKEVDPVLRVILLNRTLKYAGQTCWGDATALTELAAELETMNADEVNWMNPDDQEVAAKRALATSLLAKVNDLKKVRDEVRPRREALFGQLKISIRGTGLLLKEPTGWAVVTGVDADVGRKIFTITGKQEWFEVADVQDGKFVVNPSAVNRFTDALDGNMVFAVDP